MKKLILVSMFIGAFLWNDLNTNKLSAQTELTVPDYSYGGVGASDGATSEQGVAQSGPYGNGPTSGKAERPYDVFIAHGYRWWGFSGITVGYCVGYPSFNYPGYHGAWDMSGLGCAAEPGGAHIGFMGSWGGVIVEPASRKMWSLIGASNKDNGPTEPYVFILTYPPPSIWGSGSSDGYLRKIVQVQSTGVLQNGDPVDISASLTSQGVFEGDGDKYSIGVLFLNKESETPWHEWGMGREYLRWGDVSDILGNPNFMNNMLGNLVVDLNNAGDTTVTVAIGDVIVVEVAFNNEIKLDNPGVRGSGESQGWVGEKPLDLFSNIAYSRTDSVRNLIKKHGNSLTYDLISLTAGAVLEPLSPTGPNTDVDKDGISDVREKGPDGSNDSFDGNADGIPDFQQATVGSLHTYDGAGYITLVIPAGTELAQLKVTDNPSPTDAPLDVEFPYGFFDFSIDGLDPGEAITVSMILHNGTFVDNYYKYGITPADSTSHWYNFMYDGQTGAEINGNVISLHFVDGMRGDDDLTENGYLKEPGGPAATPGLEPEINVLPPSIDFVIRAVGDTTEAQKVIIKNNGNANLQINDISIVWSDSVHFTITNNTCSILNPSDTCSVDVIFNPQTSGNKKALLWIESNDPANPTESVILEGKGLAPMVRDYGTLAFGDVTIGDSASNVYTIKNIGNSNLQIQMVTIQEDDASDFYYSDLPEPPFNIGQNDSIMFNIVFKPGSAGDKTTILRIFTNDLDLTRIITGIGIPPAFSVEGKVTIDENTPVNDGWVLIHWWDNAEHTAWHTKNYQLLDANEFFFTDIPEGEVTLYVYPDETKYPAYLKTYLGNTAVFDDAEFFYLAHDTSDLEIILVQAPSPPNGNSEISGILVEEENGKSGSTLTYGKYNGSGTPVSETSVYLIDQSSNIFDFDITKSTGEFVFENIPVGHYKFAADYVGFFMDETNDSLIISQENQKLSIAAIANNNLITIEVENVTGITSLTETSGIYIYPNPASDHIILQFDSDMPADEYILKINSMTRKTLRKKGLQVHDASQEFTIRIDDLPGGIYIISLTGNKTIYKARFIKLK